MQEEARQEAAEHGGMVGSTGLTTLLDGSFLPTLRTLLDMLLLTAV